MAPDKLNIVFEKVKKIVKPLKEKFKEVDDTVKTINNSLKQNKIRAVCVIAGSYAKGTILKNDFDVDIFVRFDYSYKDDDLSEMLDVVLKPLNPERIHGSRDYFQIKKKGFLFEIVPVLMISDYKQAVNVTDMSPLHVGYVKTHVNKKLCDEIRLAKQFCKGIGVYGAESYIRGFSGHVLDLLIIYYGSLKNLLMQASVWGKRVIIDIESHLKDPLKELDQSKLVSPLIIVDPIQPDRNAAAALSKEKFELFKQKAREFIRVPKESFFKINKLNETTLKKKAGNNLLFIINIMPVVGKKDVVGAKVLKCFEHIETHIKKNDFNIIDCNWEFNEKKSLLYFIIKNETLSNKVIVRGPPVNVKNNAYMFKKKHPKAFVKEERLYAEEKRAYLTPRPLIKSLLKEDYVVSRVKKISIK